MAIKSYQIYFRQTLQSNNIQLLIRPIHISAISVGSILARCCKKECRITESIP